MEFGEAEGEALEETVRTMGLRQLKSKQVAKFGYFTLMDRDFYYHTSWRDHRLYRLRNHYRLRSLYNLWRDQL